MTDLSHPLITGQTLVKVEGEAQVCAVVETAVQVAGTGSLRKPADVEVDTASNLETADEQQKKILVLAQLLEACRLSVVFYSSITLAGYVQTLPAFTAWACWTAVLLSIVGGSPELALQKQCPGKGADTKTAFKKACMFAYIVPVALIAWDISAGRTFGMPATIAGGIYLLLGLLFCSTLMSLAGGQGTRYMHSPGSHTTVRLIRLVSPIMEVFSVTTNFLRGHAGMDHAMDVIYLAMARLLGSVQNVTVGVLVGGSFTQYMTPKTFWTCGLIVALSFTATEALWTTFWENATETQRLTGRRRHVIRLLLGLTAVPSAALLHAYTHGGLLLAEASELGCNASCQARFNELVLCTGITGCLCAFYALTHYTLSTQQHRSAQHCRVF